jgi:hypothetical protein
MWVVEGNRRQARTGERLANKLDRLEAEGFPTELDTIVHRQTRAECVESADDGVTVFHRSKPRLPAQRQGVVGSRYPIGGKLTVCVEQRRSDREHRPRPRHDLPLEGIAMNVYESRSEEIAASIHNVRSVACTVDRGDPAVFDAHGSGLQTVPKNDGRALDNHCRIVLHRCHSTKRESAAAQFHGGLSATPLLTSRSDRFENVAVHRHTLTDTVAQVPSGVIRPQWRCVACGAMANLRQSVLAISPSTTVSLVAKR